MTDYITRGEAVAIAQETCAAMLDEIRALAFAHGHYVVTGIDFGNVVSRAIAATTPAADPAPVAAGGETPSEAACHCVGQWGPNPDCGACGGDGSVPLAAFGETPQTAPVAAGGIYTASKTRHAARWRDLRAQGVPVISTWIDEAGVGETSCFVDLWRRCVDEARRASAVILYREDDDVLKGAFIEAGVALSAGRPVYAVGFGPEFSFLNHPLVRPCASLEEAVARAVGRTIGASIAAPVAAGGEAPPPAHLLTAHEIVSAAKRECEKKGLALGTGAALEVLDAHVAAALSAPPSASAIREAALREAEDAIRRVGTLDEDGRVIETGRAIDAILALIPKGGA